MSHCCSESSVWKSKVSPVINNVLPANHRGENTTVLPDVVLSSLFKIKALFEGRSEIKLNVAPEVFTHDCIALYYRLVKKSSCI